MHSLSKVKLRRLSEDSVDRLLYVATRVSPYARVRDFRCKRWSSLRTLLIREYRRSGTNTLAQFDDCEDLESSILSISNSMGFEQVCLAEEAEMAKQAKPQQQSQSMQLNLLASLTHGRPLSMASQQLSLSCCS
jgi:hypothetical protein